MKQRYLTATYCRRLAALLPAGIPRYVRCYRDNSNPDAWDVYTVCYTGRADKTTVDAFGKEYPYVGLSGHGSHTQPVDTIGKVKGHWYWPPALGRKCHLGTRIAFSELPAQLKKVVLEDYREIWNL